MSHQEDMTAIRFWASITWRVTTIVVVLLAVWQLAMPQARLYRAKVERQAQIADARAKADAAEFLADAEVRRAEGVAEANQIIAESITGEYIRWLYVDQLDEIDGQVIYVPTEAGIPILEATRTAPGTTSE